jgi:WD40 repeat protein
MGEPLTHTGGVLAVAFSPDGRVLASAGVNGRLQLWDVESRQQLGEPLTGHTGGAVTGVAFSPDGQVLASSGLDGTVRLWDPATASQTALLTGPGHTAQVNAVAISPDGQVLASAGADGTVRLWDVSSQRASGRPMPGHTGAVRSLAFVSNEVLSSAGDDGTVRLWDVPARRALGEPLTGHDGQVTGVAFSPLRKALASAGGDGTLRLWLTPPHWIQAACKLVGSNLTRIEWDTWIGADRSYVRTCPDLPPGRDALRDAPAGRYASPLAASRD